MDRYEQINSYIEKVVKDALAMEKRPIHAKFQAAILDDQVLVVIHTAFFKVCRRIAYRLEQNFYKHFGMRISIHFVGGSDENAGDSPLRLDPDGHIRIRFIVARVKLLEKHYQVLCFTGNQYGADLDVKDQMQARFGYIPTYYGSSGWEEYRKDYRTVMGKDLRGPREIRQLPIVKF